MFILDAVVGTGQVYFMKNLDGMSDIGYNKCNGIKNVTFVGKKEVVLWYKKSKVIL